MFTDSVQIAESLAEVIQYDWHGELRDFEESFNVEIQETDSLIKWIKWCQELPERKNHIFYHLMVLKAAYPKLDL